MLCPCKPELWPLPLTPAASVPPSPCQVSVASEAESLLPVTLADIQCLPHALEHSAAAMAASTSGASASAMAGTVQPAVRDGGAAQEQQGRPVDATRSATVAASTSAAAAASATVGRASVGAAGAAGAVGAGGAAPVLSLELEIARLRAELATQLALGALRELAAPPVSAPTAASAAGGHAGAASSSVSSSVLVAGGAPGAAAASSMQLAASSASLAAAASAASGKPAQPVPAGTVPAVVAAPVPNISEALQRHQQQLPPPEPQPQQQASALAAAHAALRMKDAYISEVGEGVGRVALPRGAGGFSHGCKGAGCCFLDLSCLFLL